MGEKLELRLRNSGMFSNVNELVQYLYMAESGSYTFYIDWRHSCYKEDIFGKNPWEYYFEQCFSQDKSESLGLLPVGKAIACSQNNIITPRLKNGQCNPLLLPKDRFLPHRLIKKYIHLKPQVNEIIDRFKKEYFNNHVIGLHLRGLGRNHGGAAQLRQQGGGVLAVDYERFFHYIDQRLSIQTDAKIFVCSDSQDVIDHVVDVYQDKVITYDATRSAFGEMHAQHKHNSGLSFSPYKLGLDVLIEAYLLSKTSYFVHGNSNVANYVLCLDPNIEADYVYQNV